MEQPEEGYRPMLVHLPLEVVEVIAGYLSIRDLAACCACSQSMRDVFSDDSIWRPRCDKELCEYLKVTPCKVEPHFIPPKFEQSSLSPIPQWKVAFMHQNHLWNNWRKGKKETEFIQSQETASSRMFDNPNYHLFLTSDCIIAVYPDRIEILDVRESPASKAASDIKFPINLRGRDVQVMAGDEMVIISYESLVQVYQINFTTKESILKDVFVIEDSHKTPIVDKVEDLKPLVQIEKQKRNRSIKIGLVGNFLVGIYKDESRMHIWDVKSGLKVKRQDCPIKQASIESFIDAGIMNLILCVEERKLNLTTFLAYNLTTLQYLPFKKVIEGDCGFSTLNKYVAIWSCGILTVHDYMSSETLLKNQPIQSYCYGFRNSFVFLQDSVLKVFLPSTQTVINFSLAPVPGKSIVMDKVSWFEVLNGKFIQVKKDFFLGVYEVDDSLRLKKSSLNLSFQSCSFFLNKTSTRYIVRSRFGNVIHFW